MLAFRTLNSSHNSGWIHIPDKASRASLKLPVQCSLRARWCLDCRYGRKGDAQILLQEWVRDIGSQAGLTQFNARISSGAVGVPESRLEVKHATVLGPCQTIAGMFGDCSGPLPSSHHPLDQLEVELDGLAELDDFWTRIPGVSHKAWSERASHVIVDASPRWDVLRSVPLLGPESAAAASSSSGAMPEQATTNSNAQGGSDVSGLEIPIGEGQAEALLAEQVKAMEQATSSGPSNSVKQQPGSRVVLDWKGDPMTINPGDKMPF